MQTMNIGQAASVSGVSAKMIRHYESIGLLAKAGRTDSGYRVYSSTDLHLLTFIRQARNLGFAIEEIRELLNLWQNRRRTSRKVKELAINHIRELDERIRELQEIKLAISHLAEHCHGDDRPECPILDGIVDGRQEKTFNTQKKTNKHRHLKNHSQS